MSALVLLAAMALGGQTPTPQLKREVNFWVARDIAPSPKIRLNINTRNVAKVRLTAQPVDGRAWLLEREHQERRPATTGPAVMSWDVSVMAGKQALNPGDNYFSRQVNLPGRLLKPGSYLITVKGGDQEQWHVVTVTNLALVVKRSPKKLLAWVTDFRTGNVVPKARVLAFDGKERPQGSAVTGADGTAVIAQGVGDTTVIVETDSGDRAATTNYVGSPDGQLRAHFQTDRPIYRPGQTVSFKAILRLTEGQGYRPIASGNVKVTVRDSRDNPLEEMNLRPSAMGTVAGSFSIPQEGITGPYSLVLETAGQSAYQTFTVAGYRKPEYKVDVTPLAKRYLAGEKVRFKINAAYYFGAPVPQAQIHWVARSSTMSFFTPDADERWFYSGDGNLYPQDTYGRSPVVGEDNAFTDNEGNVTIQFDSNPELGDQTYTVDLTVEDSSRRQVQASASVPVYAAGLRVGVTSPQSVTPQGALIPLEVRMTDLDNRPVGGKARLELIQQVWDDKAEKFKDKVIADRDIVVPPTGKLETSLPAREQGTLTVSLVAADGTGRKAKASIWTYVAGPFTKVERENNEPKVELKIDRRTYKPGQPVNAYVTTNRAKRPVLVVFEGSELFDYKVLPAGNRGRSWRVASSVKHSPNAWMTASQWTENGLMTSTVIVPVPDLTRRISVEATPDRKEVRPGDPVKIAVRTRNSAGQPVSAEVALSVVDEAIYALSPDSTPDPYGFYWGMRGNPIVTSMSAPEEVSGGAYQRSNPVAPVRRRFEDTAYWNAFVETGPNGLGTVEFEAPGNLTTWRATARGVTSSTQVGMGKSTFVATRPLTLRLATPRLVAKGDEFTLIGTVNNRSDAPVTADVKLTATGIEAPAEPQKIEVPARSEKQVKWRLKANSVPANGKFTLLAEAAGPTTDLSDALEVSVPVVPRGVRETMQTAGPITDRANATLRPPTDAMPDGATLSIRVFAGVKPAMNQAATRVLSSARYGSPAAAHGLIAAALTDPAARKDDIREALALLSRTQQSGGWGWWENTPTDPVVTAQVGHALAVARSAGIRVFDQTWQVAQSGARAQYDRSSLWEHRAQLAATMVELGAEKAVDSLNEVRERGIHLSPYAQLRVAEALMRIDRNAATAAVRKVLPLVSDGTSEAFVPVGDGIGWSATETETTAELLNALATLNIEDALQGRLANRLALRQAWRSTSEDAAIVQALAAYGKKHPVATEVGTVCAFVGDKEVELKPSTVDPSASVDLPLTSLPNGPIRIERNGSGEALYSVSLRYYRDTMVENATGVRVIRRFEVKNEAGVWTEVDRVVHPSEPVRCTVVVWGDDRTDAVRITEPIPAGFEHISTDVTSYAQEDVRDGALVHYLLNSGTPVFFRYYIRAESDGRLIALPAIAEYLRRPSQRGQSSAREIVVHP